MPEVDYKHPDYTNKLPSWDLIKDCLEGEEKIKSKQQVYLPIPNITDKSEANKERYKHYLQRAVFYNNVRPTISNLTGRVFSKNPEIEVHKDLEKIIYNANGGGISLIQSAKESLSEVLSLGRAGLLTDYPSIKEPATKQEVQQGNIKPNILKYDAKSIINWRWKRIGSVDVLSLVVLEESEVDETDPFTLSITKKYRVLLLEEGVYVVETYIKKDGTMILEDRVIPKKYNGLPFNFIPFTFIGSENNDPTPDTPPILDMAKINIAHYRNSADYEEALYMAGQPTLMISGLTEQWVDRVLKGGILLGSRSAVLLPEGGRGDLVQASPNSLPKEGMDLKEIQMIALGAQMYEKTSIEKTATEATFDQVNKTSVLSSAANNVSEAYKLSLDWCLLFTGGLGDNVFKLNTDFGTGKLSSQEQDVLLKLYQADVITKEELREGLVKGGVEMRKS